MKNAEVVFGVEKNWKMALQGMIRKEKKEKETLDISILDFPFLSGFSGFVLGYPFLRGSTLGWGRLIFK